MNSTLLPSLKLRTLVKITVELWNRNIKDLVKTSTPNYTIRESPKEWQVIEDEVIEKVHDLPLPESLKKEVLDLIQPVGLEVLKWKECHVFHFGHYLGTGLSAQLCWTPQGTVDQKKTTELLVKDESIDISMRFELACIYCLEDDVKELWNSMSERKIEDFYKRHSVTGIPDTVMALSCCLKGEVNILNDFFKHFISPYVFEFYDSAVNGYKVATEYFLKKLTPRERDESLVKAARNAAHIFAILSNKFSSNPNTAHTVSTNPPLPKEYYADVVCFLLSQMNEEQQVEMFEDIEYRPAEVLSCLLVWPWQKNFMETANRVWDLLSEERYQLLLEMIVDKVIDGYKDCNYRKLFGEFWQQSPNTHKKFIVGRCASGYLLLRELFVIEDKENLGLIFKNATLKERENMICHGAGKYICYSLLRNNKWDLLKFFIQECLSSEDTMIEFKEYYEFKRFYSEQRSESQKSMWTKFFQLLDDHIHKDNEKRGMEEGNSSLAKRLKFNQ